MKNIKSPYICILCLIVMLCVVSNVSASNLKKIHFKGWLDTEFKGNDKPGNRSYFDVHNLYLITEVTLEENFGAFVELEFEHSPNTSNNKGNIVVDRLYSQKVFSHEFGVRVGKYSTPFGHWTPTHWDILVETTTKPIHESNHYIPAQSVGIETFGTFFTNQNEIEWSLFFSNGSENKDTDEPEDESFGGGGDLRFILHDGHCFAGASYYYQKNPEKESRSENSFVGYLGSESGNFDFKGEYVYQKRSGGYITEYSDISTFYVSGKYFVSPGLALGTRYDYGDDEKECTLEKKSLTTLFLNWSPIPEVVGKAEFGIHKFESSGCEDYNSWALYFGIIF